MKLILLGKPRSTGTLYKTMCRGNFPITYLIQEGKNLKEDYAWQVKQQWKLPMLKEENIKLEIYLYLGSKRKSDWDNFHKLSMDSCTGIVWEDDSLITDVIVHKRYDSLNPRIEIEVQSIK